MGRRISGSAEEKWILAAVGEGDSDIVQIDGLLPLGERNLWGALERSTTDPTGRARQKTNAVLLPAREYWANTSVKLTSCSCFL